MQIMDKGIGPEPLSMREGLELSEAGDPIDHLGKETVIEAACGRWKCMQNCYGEYIIAHTASPCSQRSSGGGRKWWRRS